MCYLHYRGVHSSEASSIDIGKSTFGTPTLVHYSEVISSSIVSFIFYSVLYWRFTEQVISIPPPKKKIKKL